MTAPISGNRPFLPLAQSLPAEPVSQKPVMPLEVAEKRMLPVQQDASSFEAGTAVAARGAMPALIGGAVDAVAQKGLGAQAAIGEALGVATRALASAQAGIQLAAGLASSAQAQFAGLQGAATNALAGAAQMPLNIANQVAGVVNGGSGARQLDVLQGMAYTQGPLAAGNVEAGQYSADQLGQYADPYAGQYADPYAGQVADPYAGQYADPYAGQYADPASQLGQFFGGVGDLAGGVGDLADLGDQFRRHPSSNKPNGPESKPSTPDSQSTRPNGPESKPSTPDARPSSAPDVKPSGLAGKADDLAKTALKTGGKALSRFIPGANVAMAGLDIANAVKTFKDPNASVGDKITSGIVAGGSALAATNIPIVSQVGGLISTGTSVVSEVVKNFGGEIKDVAKKVGEGVKDTAKKVGEGIKDTAEKVGEGIKDTAKKVGEGIKDFFKGW
ncbi:hypothetical protein [Hyalangium gracile]|uniref:hypothetical protein n=1 Tax=Hyalangium gracile TaxID=394092 RepID=UPI001CD0202E|nr:hypothetical protein [Hyalangium gracile]